MFDWLYDDSAPSPLDQLKKAKEKMNNSQTWQSAKTAAKAGMMAGVFVGGFIIAVGAAKAVNRVVFGNK